VTGFETAVIAALYCMAIGSLLGGISVFRLLRSMEVSHRSYHTLTERVGEMDKAIGSLLERFHLHVKEDFDLHDNQTHRMDSVDNRIQGLTRRLDTTDNRILAGALLNSKTIQTVSDACEHLAWVLSVCSKSQLSRELEEMRKTNKGLYDSVLAALAKQRGEAHPPTKSEEPDEDNTE
jgi:hypothetical protein